MRQDIFEIEEILINGGAAVASGIGDPNVTSLDYPAGSLYLRTNGELWSKGELLWELVIKFGSDSLECVGVLFRIRAGKILTVSEDHVYFVNKSTLEVDGDIFLEGDSELIVNE